MHSDSHDDQKDDRVLKSPLHALASVYARFLEDPTFELAPAHIEDKAPEEHITYDDPKPCLKGSSPKKYTESFAKKPTPLHHTMKRLTQNIAQLKIQDEKYVKLISELREENKELRLQVKSVEDLNNAKIASHISLWLRHDSLKDQFKRLSDKSTFSFKTKEVATAAQPSS